MAELPVAVFEELAPFRLTELVVKVLAGVREEPARLRLTWVVVELLVGLQEPQRPRWNWVVVGLLSRSKINAPPSGYTDFMVFVSVGLQKEPERLRFN